MLLTTLALAISGCQDPEIRACDEAVKAKLKSPSTYKRISQDGVEIVYEAVNSFNAPIRDRGNCYYDRNTDSAVFYPHVELQPLRSYD
jgi:hypothetical protein